MRKTQPLVVGGEDMINLLNRVSMNTLNMIMDDLGDPAFTNTALIKAVQLVRENRRSRKIIGDYDTLVDDREDWCD